MEHIAHLSKDKKYGEIWNKIYSEYVLTEKYLYQLSGKNELMADYPVEQLSIGMRERIVLPLATIQQFAILSSFILPNLSDDKKRLMQKD